MVGYNITVGLGGSGFQREDLPFDQSELGWEGRDPPSTARWSGGAADGLGSVGFFRWVGFAVLLDRPTPCHGCKSISY